jgi:hypothetical protein
MEVIESDSTSDQPQDISKSTQKIVNEIKTLEKELEEIQNSCSHSNYSIKNSPQGPENGFCLRRICDACQAVLGYPTQEEINKWMSS